MADTKASRPAAIYQWQEGVEELANYCSGGYHPVHIGDRYSDGRYEIVHKLGHGSYSTVWLAQDRQKARLVAVKFLMADASVKPSERTILARLASGSREHAGRRHVASMLDDFFVQGPNGRHRCIVSEAAACSVAQCKECSDTWKFPAKTARSICAQVLRGLAYVQSCGVVHGDLHSNNILFKMPELDSYSVQESYGQLGEPQRLPVDRLDGKPNGPEVPSYCVPPALIFCSCEEIDNADILIADFGESFLHEASGGAGVRAELRTPVLLLPPEAIFDEPFGPAVDVWTAACTLYEILGERPLFEGFMPDTDHAVAEMVSTLGPLPKRWWDRWPARSDFFLEDGSWDKNTSRRHAPWSRPLGERLAIIGRTSEPAAPEFDAREMVLLERLLRQMLTYEPTQRISAADALTTEWVKEYAQC